MGIVSYAQNFEDVILWRALAGVSEGFYIDIGAWYPVADSVSKWFYDQGWRGIHVEPVTELANLLRLHRPDETVIQAIVAEVPGVTPFYEIPGTGLSTARADIAQEHQASGREIVETLVTAITLDSLLDLAPSDDIHWLKIDVEGFEREVLNGWRDSPRRPWIVVIEATYPNTQLDTYADWEALVLEKGYRLVHFDGLNRFYLHESHADLEAKFALPPNVFDGFQVSETQFCAGMLVQSHKRIDAQLESELGEARAAVEACEQKCNELIRREQDLRIEHQRRLEDAEKRIQEQQRDWLDREQLLTQRLLQLQEQSQRIALEQENAYVQRQATLEAELQTLRDTLEREKESAAARERELHRDYGQKLTEAQREAQSQIEALLQRERELTEQLLRQQETARQEALVQQRVHGEREHALTTELRTEQKQRHTLELELAEKARLLADAQALNNRLQDELSAHVAQHQQLTEELARIHQSVSWRLIKPLRRLETGLTRSRPHIVTVNDAEKPVARTEAPSAAKPISQTPESMERTKQETLMKDSNTLNDLMQRHGEDFIHAAYWMILGRAPDAEGLRYYLGRLQAGYGKRSVVAQIASSPERTRLEEQLLSIKNDEDFVTAAYKTLLKRAPDQEGQQHYLDSLRKGKSRQHVLRDIASSKEAKALGPTRWQFEKELQDLIKEERRARHWFWGRFGYNERLERKINGLEFVFGQEMRELRNLTRKLSQLQIADNSNPAFNKKEQAYGDSLFRSEELLPPSHHPDHLRISKMIEFGAEYGVIRSAIEGRVKLDDYLTGAYPPEGDLNERFRWVGHKVAKAYLKMTGSKLVLGVAGVFDTRKIEISVNDKFLTCIIARPEPGELEIAIPEYEGNNICVSMRSRSTINLARSGISPDTRDLGFILHYIYVR